MAFCSKCGSQLVRDVGFCSGCGAPVTQAQATPPPPAQKAGDFIGGTPQQQLAVIKYVHKRANIIGLIGGILFALPLFNISGMLAREGMGVESVFLAIAVPLGGLIGALCYARTFVWSFYYFTNKFDLLSFVAILPPLAYEEQYLETTYTTYQDYLGRVTSQTKVKTELKLNFLTLIILFIGLTFGFWFGIVLAIKYIALQAKLKKQLKAA